MTLRRALGEHPTCPSKRRRLKNALSVSAPTPRLRPNTNSVATTRRISQARPAGVSQHDDSGERSRRSMAWRWRCTLLLESPVRSARLRMLCLPYARIALKMPILLAHNPMVSVRALKGGGNWKNQLFRVRDRPPVVPLYVDAHRPRITGLGLR